VFARVLFEAGVLYGGADAKALMIAGLLVPLFPMPFLVADSSPLALPAFVPFPIDLLMNAALLSIAVPIAVAVRNLVRGDFRFGRGFTGFYLPVRELPDRFVWVRDPSVPSLAEREEAVETSEQDQELRREIARELSDRGLSRVWVTPQLPFLVLMGLGAVTALLAGNLVVDLIQLL
jgi:preflagellin peptidase FlaK